MGWLEIVVLVLLALNILTDVYVSIYTRFEAQKELKKKRNQLNQNSNKSNNSTKMNKSNLPKVIYTSYRMFEQFSYGLMRYRIIMVGKIPSYRIRNFLYRYVYKMNITSKTKIAGGCEFRSPWNLKADNCIIGLGCILDARSGITIGNNTVLGGGVHIWTEEHSVDDPYFRVLDDNAKPVIIKDYVWLGSDSTILPGCVINEGAIVASRACVTKDCEDYGIYAGIPAKKIRIRNKNLVYKLKKRPGWWLY